MLITNGNWYTKAHRKSSYKVKHYKTIFCEGCQARSLCTKNPAGRLIERSEFTPYIERNRQNIEENKDLYKKRQAIIEHVFGTIKRQCGYCHILSKRGKQRASGDVGLIFTAYNLRRIMNIVPKNNLKAFLDKLIFKFLTYLRVINPVQPFNKHVKFPISQNQTANSAIK